MHGSINGSIGGIPSPVRGDGQRILVVVDDPGTTELLATTLELAGYQVGTAGTIPEAVVRFAEHPSDLVVIDTRLAESDGFTGYPRVAPADRPPVLFLTACESLGRLVPEMGLGLADYVTQPLRIAEVLARAQVLLRARGPERLERAPRYGDLVLNDATCRARRGGRALDLTPAEYRLLRHLLVNAERVLSKEQICRHVWGESRADNAIEKLVSRLRHKVDQDRDEPGLIHTRRGFGYWLGR
ncbi:response regulator transcription factor [Streptomyces sp. NPDC057617]|uniref:response regulator transcription factor n=1 Tax=unclassified Streptomyces TaxID=2593676 RepID=UPI00368461AA